MKNLLLFIFIISLNNVSLAQIIYHQFNPPVLTTVYESEGDTTKLIFLDINDDSVNDFRFMISYWYQFSSPAHDQAFYSGVLSFNKSKIGVINTTFPCNAIFLNVNDTISSRLTWDTIAGIMYLYPGALYCHPLYPQLNYLPIEIKLNGQIHYGWILLNTSMDEGGYGPEAMASLNIYDFAFNSKPGEGLISGDTLTSLPSQGINNITEKDLIRIFPNPVVDNVNIKSSILFIQIQLIDIYGNILLNIQNNLKESSIDFSNIEPGIYILKFFNNNFCVTKKIIKE
jgi:hypothetical protein